MSLRQPLSFSWRLLLHKEQPHPHFTSEGFTGNIYAYLSSKTVLKSCNFRTVNTSSVIKQLFVTILFEQSTGNSRYHQEMSYKYSYVRSNAENEVLIYRV